MIPLRDNVPTQRFPVVTVALIAANVAVWLLYQLRNLQETVVESGFWACEVADTCTQVFGTNPPGGPWQIDAFTSMFMHGGWLHLIFNMVFLWIFGNNVEDRMGRIRFLVFYVAAGLAAVALQAFVTLELGSVEDAAVPMVGASGAIAGVLGAYLRLFPRARVLSIFFFFLIIPIELPAIYFLGGWFLFQLWQGGFGLLAPDGIGTGGVAFFAHIGGFVFGMLTVNLFTYRRRRPPRYTPREPAWPRAEA